MFGAISDSTTSAFPPNLSMSSIMVLSWVMSPMTVSTPSSGLMYLRSTPMTFPLGQVRSCATCSHPPGQAPRSTTWSPDLKIPKRLSIWMSLKDALER